MGWTLAEMDNGRLLTIQHVRVKTISYSIVLPLKTIEICWTLGRRMMLPVEKY